MKKNLAFLSLALACLTAAPHASADYVWQFREWDDSYYGSERDAWDAVKRINTECHHSVYAGKTHPVWEKSVCASAPARFHARSWIVRSWVWVASDPYDTIRWGTDD